MNSHPSTQPRYLAYIAWILASFFAFFQFFLQSAAGIFGAEWVKDFHLNKIELGNLSSAFYYTYTLMQIPAGILFDRYQPRTILAPALLILTLGILLLAYTHDYTIAIVARLLMGVGSSFGFIGLLQVCASYFGANRFTLMLGISEGITMFAVTASIMLLTWFMSFFSWRIAMAGSGVVTFILMLLIFYFFRHQSPQMEKQALSAKTILRQLQYIFTKPQVILGSLYGFFMFAIVSVFASLWGFLFLTHTYVMDRQLAANMIAIVFVGIAIGSPISGWLTKLSIEKRSILIIASALASITMGIIIFCPHLSYSLLYFLLFLSGLLCSAYIQCFAIIKDAVHPSLRATALAASNMLIMFAAPILQILIGWLLEHQFFGLTTNVALNYRLSLGLIPIGMMLAFILSFWLKEPLSD